MKRALFLVTALIACTALAAPLAAASLTVQLPESIECRPGPFYLGEYASFEGDEATAGDASMAEITPRDGSFSRNDVVAALALTPLAGKDVLLRMPERVMVLPEMEVARRLRSLTGWGWRIETSGVTAKELARGFSLPPRVSPGARAVTVKLERGEGKKPAGKQVKLRWLQPVLVAKRGIERGEALSAELFSLRMDEIGPSKELSANLGEIAGTTADSFIAAGQPLQRDELRRSIVVKGGTMVSLVANVRGLGVTASGMALERGSPGDVIRVRNLASRKIVLARIIDGSRVEVIQ